MKGQQTEKFDQLYQMIANGVQPDNHHLMNRTMEGKITAGLDEKTGLVEIMQADHDASQVEQYLMENTWY